MISMTRRPLITSFQVDDLLLKRGLHTFTPVFSPKSVHASRDRQFPGDRSRDLSSQPFRRLVYGSVLEDDSMFRRASSGFNGPEERLFSPEHLKRACRHFCDVFKASSHRNQLCRKYCAQYRSHIWRDFCHDLVCVLLRVFPSSIQVQDRAADFL